MINTLIQAVTVSPDATDPSEWGLLAEKAGPNAMIILAILALVVFVLSGIGWLIYKGMNWTIGKEGWAKEISKAVAERIVSLADKLETNSTAMSETTRKHMENCDRIHVTGGPCNVVQIEAAAHHAAEALRNIGQGKPCDVQADAIHDAFRGVARPHTDNTNVSQTIKD